MIDAEMFVAIGAFKRAAYNQMVKAEAEAERLRRLERRALANAAEERASMPKDYWEARWRAEQMSEAAKALCAALHEDET